MSTGKVYLIGAGCGEYDLITLKGLELLKESEVIVYDSLIDEKLLEFAPEAEKICVGKRAGRKSEKQENINSILIEKALLGKTVARLKGGDPFVFGRGGEEIIAISEHNIPFEIVPGITSSVAVPELAGIPVTHRSVSRSFHVITGHTKEDRLPEEMSSYAKLSGTLVFLMGLNHLKAIADSLIENGKSPKTPAAVISNGGRKNQKVTRGTLLNIAEKSVENNMVSPAVIVVGDTAAYDFISRGNKELTGVSVAVTGTKRFSDRLAAKLENSGAIVDRANILQIQTNIENPELKNALNEIEKYTMIVLTSPNGAEIFIRSLRINRIDMRRLHHIRFAVIGNATAFVLEQNGIYADIIPESYTSEMLGNDIVSKSDGNENVLILRAVQGAKILTEILYSNNISYNDIKTYDVVESEKNIPKEIATDFLVFASCSGVEDFYRQGYSISPKTKTVCIGFATASELKKHGETNIFTPEIQNAESIVELIKKQRG